MRAMVPNPFPGPPPQIKKLHMVYLTYLTHPFDVLDLKSLLRLATQLDDFHIILFFFSTFMAFLWLPSYSYRSMQHPVGDACLLSLAIAGIMSIQSVTSGVFDSRDLKCAASASKFLVIHNNLIS